MKNQNCYDDIHFVLNRTSHPGNIGASARALHVMNFEQLVLVSPDEFPSPNATNRATHAKFILEKAKVYPTLEEALADKQLVFALSARNRGLNWPFLDVKQAAVKIWEFAEKGNQIAIVFGREDSGLSNEELAKAHYLVHIPSKPGANSLNLSMAVQIMAHELYALKAGAKAIKNQFRMDEPLAKQAEIQHLLRHLNQLLVATGFLINKPDVKLKTRLRRIFQKAQLDQQEATLMRGIFASMLKYQTEKKSARKDKSMHLP